MSSHTITLINLKMALCHVIQYTGRLLWDIIPCYIITMINYDRTFFHVTHQDLADWQRTLCRLTL